MKKIAIIYGELSNKVQKKAAELLSEFLLDYTYEYPLCVKYGETVPSELRCIYIGTVQNNPYLRNVVYKVPTQEQGYYIKVENDTVIICGHDDVGVMYGCIDFYGKYIVKHEYPHTDNVWVNFFENPSLPPFEISSFPAVSNRGLWTWGHVIYDYKKYLDNMTKLKLNSLVIWNDHPPVNAEDIVAYAHSCGIKLLWGFSWMWDTDCTAFDPATLDEAPAKIFAQYEKQYASLGGDGIYFQSFTELGTEYVNGVLIADAVTKLVNKTAALFFEKYPDTELQFGLHATSVSEKLEYIKNVDPGVRIVWENCGSFPFSYLPSDCDSDSFAKTMEFVGDICNLRGNDERFGAVTKGFVKLDWTKFEHMSAPHFLGVSSERMKLDRVIRKSRIWKYIQAYWLTNAAKAHEAVAKMAYEKKGDLFILALVEDGMFEENIMYPVALYSEMLWDCTSDTQALMTAVALREYVDFA